MRGHEHRFTSNTPAKSDDQKSSSLSETSDLWGSLRDQLQTPRLLLSITSHSDIFSWAKLISLISRREEPRTACLWQAITRLRNMCRSGWKVWFACLTFFALYSQNSICCISVWERSVCVPSQCTKARMETTEWVWFRQSSWYLQRKRKGAQPSCNAKEIYLHRIVTNHTDNFNSI